MSIATFFTRLAVFLALCVVWYFNLLLVALPLTVWYLYHFRAYDLIVLGLCIDIYFWSAIFMPYYTVGFLGAVLLIEVIKPRLRRHQLV